VFVAPGDVAREFALDGAAEGKRDKGVDEPPKLKPTAAGLSLRPTDEGFKLPKRFNPAAGLSWRLANNDEDEGFKPLKSFGSEDVGSGPFVVPKRLEPTTEFSGAFVVPKRLCPEVAGFVFPKPEMLTAGLAGSDPEVAAGVGEALADAAELPNRLANGLG
jgi:hypothetical protein